MMTQFSEIQTSAGTSSFTLALTQELMSSVTNWYGADNWDAERFGAYQSSLKSSLLARFNKMFPGGIAVVPRDITREIRTLSSMRPSIESLSSLYNLLADDSSKSTLVKLIAYRVMGPKKVKLPLNTADYWAERESARNLIKGTDTIKVTFNDWVLNHFDLDKIGYPIRLFYLPGGVFATFFLKQYEYRKMTPTVKANEGDYVIDAGACWGDTALYFAHNVGAQGKVFSFEFSPENLEVFRRNMQLNPKLSERIEVVSKALWDSSDEEITFSENGPATSLRGSDQNASRVSTQSIDDFCSDEKLPRLDFIKMDIEGAELNALKGAEATIRAFRPKLAISLYHRETDLVEIPSYLDSLGVGYQFFLDHFTIFQEETVLFADTE